MVAHLADRISYLILKTQSLFWNQIVRINQITWTFKYDTALSWFCQAVKSNQKSLIHGISCVTVYRCTETLDENLSQDYLDRPWAAFRVTDSTLRTGWGLNEEAFPTMCHFKLFIDKRVNIIQRK